MPTSPKNIRGLPKFDDGTTGGTNFTALGNTLGGIGVSNLLGASGVTSATANANSGGEYGTVNSDAQTAMSMLQNAVDPQLASLIPQLSQQVQQGTMTPAQAQAAIQQKSAMLGIQVSPSLMQAQTAALNGLQQIATQGGLTATDRAQLQDINNQVNSQNAARQGAIQQQMQSQGIGGSGADIAQRLAAGQTANETAGQNAVQVGANAQQRALQALQSSGQLGGQIQGEQFGEQAQQAQAQDAINQFNAQNQQQASLTNAANAQNANTQNFQMANQIAGTNTGIQNQQAMMPLTTAETQSQLNTAAGAAAGSTAAGTGKNLTQIGQNISGTSQQTANSLTGNSGLGSLIGQGIGAAANYFSEGTPDDMDSMLEKLSGIKYKYKAPTPKSEGAKKDASSEEHGAIVDCLRNLHGRVKGLEA